MVLRWKKSHMIRCQQNSRLYFVFAAPGMVQKKQTRLFFRLVIFSSMHFVRLASFRIGVDFFLFMHFSSYAFRSFCLSVFCSLSLFVRYVPLCKYPQTRFASAQLRAGSATLGSKLGLGSRRGTRAWLITDGFVDH